MKGSCLMRNLIMVVALMPLMAAAHETWTDPSTGLSWTYVLQGDGRRVS